MENIKITLSISDWYKLKDYIQENKKINSIENDNTVDIEMSPEKWTKFKNHIIIYERNIPQFHALYVMMKFGKPEIKIGKSYKHPDILSNYDYNSRGNGAGYLLIGYWSGLLYYNFEQSILNHALIKPYRIKNKHGNLSEWANINLDTVKYVVKELTSKYVHNLEYTTTLDISRNLNFSPNIYKYSIFSENSTIDNIDKLDNFDIDSLIKVNRKDEVFDIIYNCNYKNYCEYCNNSNNDKYTSYNCLECEICDALRSCQKKEKIKKATDLFKNDNCPCINKTKPIEVIVQNKVTLKNEKVNINNTYIQINIHQNIFNQNYIKSKDRFFEVFIRDKDNNLENLKHVFIYLMCRSKAIQLFPNEKYNLVTTHPLSAGLYTIEDNVLHGILRYKHTHSSRMTLKKLENITHNDKINIIAHQLNYYNNIKDNHSAEQLTSIINTITLTNSYGSVIEDFYKSD